MDGVQALLSGYWVEAGPASRGPGCTSSTDVCHSTTTVSGRVETGQSSPDVTLPALPDVPTSGSVGPVVGLFEVCLPWSVGSLMECPEAVEARYGSFIQSSRSFPTHPLLDLLPLWGV